MPSHCSVSGRVAADLALARVVDEELRDLAERPSLLAAVDDQSDAAPLGTEDALLDRVRQIRTAGADIGAEDVGTVAFVMDPAGQRDRGIRQMTGIAEHVERLPADRRKEDLQIAAGDQFRIRWPAAPCRRP